MTSQTEKRALQIVVAIACLVPLSAGLGGALSGGKLLHVHITGDLDNHFRYLSGLLLGIGFGFLSAIPRIEHQTPRFRLLTFIVIVGGFARLLGFFLNGIPSPSMQAALAMELLVTPLLCLWQGRIARIYANYD